MVRHHPERIVLACAASQALDTGVVLEKLLMAGRRHSTYDRLPIIRDRGCVGSYINNRSIHIWPFARK